MTGTDKMRAKVDAGLEHVREWQRGATSLNEMIRRLDLTAAGEAAVRIECHRLADRSQVREMLFAAYRS